MPVRAAEAKERDEADDLTVMRVILYTYYVSFMKLKTTLVALLNGEKTTRALLGSFERTSYSFCFLPRT